MTDSHPTPNSNATQASAPTSGHNPQPDQPQYEGTDPDLRASAEQSDRRVNVSTVQVGASAAAAVTSALAASFFGVAGTLIGAAVGSIVSTIAGTLYADYLRRAGRRIRDTKSVVIQRIPGEVLATTPLRHLTSPTDLPGEASMRAIGDETEDEAIALPLSSSTELLAERGERPWWRRPAVTLPAVGIAGFAIAIGAVSVAELIKGGPISGGTGAPSIVGGSTTHKKAKSTPTVTPTQVATTTTPTSTPDPTSTAVLSTAPVLPTASTLPQDTATTAPTPTGEATAPAAGATPSN
jgi:hypothetical protein